MHQRRLLLIHDSPIFRRLVKKVVLGQLGNIRLHEATSAAEGLKCIANNKYEAIMCADEMAEMSGIQLFHRIKNEPPNQDTPFILLTPYHADEDIQRLQNAGIDCILRVPFDYKEIVKVIDSLADPRRWRAHERLNIPETHVILGNGAGALKTEAINISLGGLLCEMAYAESIPRLAQQVELTFSFPEAYSDAQVRAKGFCLRQEVSGWETRELPEMVLMGWKFTHIEGKEKKKLSTILDKASGKLKAHSQPKAPK
ncbi:MAG: response regulator [bacterium]|nr:response regulator [bacterium]